jgi:antitoxin (DNA-binding transcriptional repressor) of toxin-antitoxin stability system
LRGHTGRGEPIAELIPIERALVSQRTLDHRNPTLGSIGGNPLLREAPSVAGAKRRRGQRLEPWIVLAAD